MIGH